MPSTKMKKLKRNRPAGAPRAHKSNTTGV